MNAGDDAGIELARALVAADRSGLGGVDLLVCPPHPVLSVVGEIVRPAGIGLGAQTFHPAPSGAYTGEVSAPMLIHAGCAVVLVGHSERRQIFGETDADVRLRVEAALGAGLVPVVCVGETEAEREDGLTDAVLERQVVAALAGLDVGRGRVEIAYEPVWAIGTGRTATPEIVADAHATLRRLASATQGDGFAASVRVLYGGSVKPDNAAALLSLSDVDGALVGGASLDPGSFLAIAAAASGNA
jgi:triosephosphate isomerase